MAMRCQAVYPWMSLSLYRVLQEAVCNAAKHSAAWRFEVDLFETVDAIHLIVRDSGLGFNMDVAMKGEGLVSSACANESNW